jgi:hypothetical protein
MAQLAADKVVVNIIQLLQAIIMQAAVDKQLA